jgi:hypothetical protein
MPRVDYDNMQLGEKEPFEARVGGRDIILPPELPAKILLDVANYGKGRDELGSEDELQFGFMLIEGVIGKDNYDHVFKHLGMNGITKFVEDIMDYYGLGPDDDEAADGEDGQGKEGEELASGTSSDIGDTSTQTSNGSTPKPGEPSMTLVSTTDRSSPESDTSSVQKGPSSRPSSSKKTRRRR